MSTHMSNKLKIFLYSTIAYVFCTFVATMFLSTLWCRPIKRNWSLGPDFCNPMQYHTYVQIYTVLNATGDFLVMLVPTLILKTMQVRRGEKWAVAFLLFLGFLTIGATSARAAYLGRLAVATTADSTQDPGMLVSNIHICEIWSFFEVSAAVTALCLPSLRGYILKNRRAHANDVHQQIDTEGTTVPESPMQSASGASLTSKKEMAGEESGLKFWNSTESKQSYGRSSRGSDGGMARPADVRLPQYDRKVYH